MKEGLEYAEGVAQENKAFVVWCGTICSAMIEKLGELHAKLEAEGDESEKLQEAALYSEAVLPILLTMTSMIRDKEHMSRALREECELSLLECCNGAAGLAEANLAVAGSLGAEVVGPVKSTLTLAKKLSKDFFAPALKEAEAAEAAIPKLVAEIDKPNRFKGSDVPSLCSEILRFKRELETLKGVLEESPFVPRLTALQGYLQAAKPIVELLDD